MRKAFYQEKPLENEDIRSIGIRTLVIRFFIHETERGWECEEVEYSHKEELTDADYPPMVSTIIRGKYSEDAVEAILNNYLADPTDEHHATEFNLLQSWRNEAKERARKIIDSTAE